MSAFKIFAIVSFFSVVGAWAYTCYLAKEISFPGLVFIAAIATPFLMAIYYLFFVLV